MLPAPVFPWPFATYAYSPDAMGKITFGARPPLAMGEPEIWVSVPLLSEL